MKEVVYSRDAAKDLRRHDNMADRIQAALAEYAAGDGARANSVTQLVGSPARRLRVGRFRIIFEETETTITVTRIGPRGGVYGDD